jgi:ribonuclease R
MNSKKNSKKIGRGRKTKAQLTEGIIAISSRQTGYVPYRGDDIEIDPQYLGSAWAGDTVLVEILGKKKGAYRGKVKKIVNRAHPEVVGTITITGEQAILIPDNRKLRKKITLSAPKDKALKPNYKAIVKITSWGTQFEHPEGELEKILGPKGDHEVEMTSILFDKGFIAEFPNDVEQEAQKIAAKEKPIPPEEIAKRTDFRNTLTFTIDPFDAKDFDDALSYKKLENGHLEVGIHIADVSHYVLPGTELDAIARERGFSVYLVDRTIPMLPEVLSNDLCSLNPEEEKLAFSVIFEIDDNGKVYDYSFEKAIIKSDKRFAYEEAQKSIDENGQYSKELSNLNDIAKKIRKDRIKSGAIDFETDEVQFELDKDFKPVKVYRKERLDTHKLVEEFMLLANRYVGEYMFKAHKKDKGRGIFMYRVHDLPNQEKLGQLSIFLKAIGFDFKVDPDLTSKDIQAMLQKIEGHADESLIKTAAIRSMAKAIYSTKNIGHFGLAFQYYSHFTSPIRRYPDLIAHRILHGHLTGNHVNQQDFALFSNIASEASSKEVSAAEAERESIKLKQVEYMAEHIGAEFTGIISGVTEWGMYIEEKETKAEGMIKIETIGEDYFELDQKTYSIVGKKTGEKYTLGASVKFKVVGADVDRKQLDFELVKKDQETR